MMKVNNTEFHKGIHIIADLWECSSQKLSFVKDVKELMKKAVEESELSSLNDYFFQFEPFGVTGVYVLSQSHFSIHTWPEKNFVSIDIFTCGPPEKALKAFEVICNELKPKRIEKKFLERMNEGNSIETIKTRNIIAIKKRA
jgi:S-adenosylmethionine decarboxylase